MAHTVITVGREFGSGGRIVAQRVAQALGIPFYDRAVIQIAAEESGLSQDFIHRTETTKVGSFLFDVYMSTQNLPVSHQVFLAESRVIRRVAEEGPCVIVGRCADYVLRNRESAFHAFLHAPLEQRVLRAEQEYGLKGADIAAQVKKIDKGRASYYEHFTDSRWGRAQNYHLSVNSALGVDKAVELVLTLAGKGHVHGG